MARLGGGKAKTAEEWMEREDGRDKKKMKAIVVLFADYVRRSTSSTCDSIRF